MLTRSFRPSQRRLPGFRSHDPVRSLHQQMNDLFADFWGQSPASDWPETTAFVPSIDLTERDDSLVLSAEVPGMQADDLEVDLQDDLLIIRGEKRSEEESDDSGHRYREIRTGSFERAIPLPTDIDPDQVEAAVHDGVLRISMRKAPDAGRRRITVSPRQE